MRGLRRLPGLISLTLVLSLGAAPLAAVDGGTVDRYLRLSSQFHERLSRSPVAGLSRGALRDRAVCILTRIENAHGSRGVDALMELMAVLSRGAEFDDATIVGFNRRYGPSLSDAETACTRAARSS